MTHINFTFRNTKPLSVNAAKAINWKTKRHHNSEKYGILKQRIQILMMCRRKEIEAFERAFNPKLQHLFNTIKVYVPKPMMFLKGKEEISSRKGDNSNQIKVIEDIVFSFFNKIDDRYTCNSQIRQIVSPNNEWHIEFSLKAMENTTLYE